MAPRLTKAQKEANLKANEERSKKLRDKPEYKRMEKLSKSSSSKAQMERDLARIKKLAPAPKDRDYRSGFTKSGEETQQLGRKPKVAPSDKPPRGSGNYMSQFDKDLNAAKKKGDVKEQKRLMNVKKSIEANIKAKNKTKGGPKMGANPKDMTIKGGPGPKGKFLKRLNMGGAIMKNRGGMFKGTY